MPSFRIAAAQSVSVSGDIPANVAGHCDFIIKASAYKVDVVVFPELSLCGYELPMIGACALQPDDDVLAPIRALVRSKALSVIIGAPVISKSGHIHIGAITYFSDGRTSIYRKHHLHPGEERFATSCSLPSIAYQVGNESFALAICADTAYEQHAQAAADVGASLYLASVLVSDGGYANDTGNLRRYAERHSMVTLMANHGGPTGSYVSAGKSAIWSEEGTLVAAAPGVGKYLVIADKKSAGWVGEVHKI